MNLEDAEDRRRALEVECPWCHAAAGDRCRRSDGSLLERVPAHTPRLAEAGVLHAPIDSRELRGPPQYRRRRPATHTERTPR